MPCRLPAPNTESIWSASLIATSSRLRLPVARFIRDSRSRPAEVLEDLAIGRLREVCVHIADGVERLRGRGTDDVVDDAGTVQKWQGTTGANPNRLIRSGWRKEDLPAGTVLQIEGWQARNGSPTANISSVTFPDGRRLFAGTSNKEAPQQ